MIAAVNVFKSLGEEAPYCKFLYPPEKLQVFQHSRLGVYVAVAFEISMMEGKTSYKNYQGVSRTDLSPELQAKCRQIVTLFGGAKTKTTFALRKEILQDSQELSELQTALDSGLPLNVVDAEGPASPT
ncbi:unnamed protein product [Macrosiphum euphorbiae]|uniref:Uncharacterized protein n=1 Tax=Macrosiphum euphorbiae TaxID=13131 RepID=A0AAV0XGR7_9HEMI|nr:unnamed protein product [Macrosiphum euphorbiae]